ncbi:SGNH/GDSL hydrolase family protein, partial [Nocardioides sp.]|uniref:SGNH/GDSL hydrolase family protein n=1 Tax=Nocardioides sp. TaxID=35761 RepID=UPI0025ED3866
LRSGANYPALVATAMPGTALTDVSCSGASTRNTVSPQVGRTGSVPPQFDALRPGTDLVTIGLGGNDGQLFGGVLGRCVQIAATAPAGAPCRQSFERQDPERLDTTFAHIERNIAAVVRGVRERSPQARVVVVGYPQIIPESGTCELLPLADGDYAFAREINEGLNRAVERGADDAGADFVDLWEPTAGHDICADEPWINGRVTSVGTALAYHPLAVEQERVVDRDAGHDRVRRRHLAQRRADGRAVALQGQRVAVQEHQVSPRARPHHRLPVDGRRQRLAHGQGLLTVP